MANDSAVALLLQGLNSEEQQELSDIATYLGEKAGPGNPSGHMAEGSVASLLNRASPKVRTAIGRISDLIETPRGRPFDPKLSEAEHLHLLGLDPDTGVTIKAALDGQEVASKTIDRLGGSDAQLPDAPLTTRDILSAAYDKHSQE